MRLFARKTPAPVVAKPVASAAPMLSYEQVKAQLKSMAPADLAKAHEAARKRATPDRIPLTIKALSALHREAVYVKNGEIDPATIYVDPFRDALAFVNKRERVSNMPVEGHSFPVLPADHWSMPKPTKIKKTVRFDLPALEAPAVKPLKGILKNKGA